MHNSQFYVFGKRPIELSFIIAPVLGTCLPKPSILFDFSTVSGSMRESSEDHVTLTAFSSTTLALVLDYVYGGCLRLNEENIEDVVAVASYLQIHCVLQCCCDFVRHTLSVDNCVDYLRLAFTFALDTIPSQDVHQDCILKSIEHFILKNISDIVSSEYVKVPIETMRKLVASNEIRMSELHLYRVIVNWLLADPSRKEYCDELLKNIRFTLIPLQDLEKLQVHPDCDTATVRDMIGKALKYVSLPLAKKIQWASPVDQVRGKPCVTALFSKTLGDNDFCKDLHVLIENNDDYDVDGSCTHVSDADGERKDVHQISKGAMWVQLPFPEKFNVNHVASIKDFMFICEDSCGPVSEPCHVFDPVTWQWDKIACMNICRASFTLVAHNEELYVIGGMSDNLGYIDSIEKYSLQDNSWEIVAHYHVAAAEVAAMSAAGLLYMYGGEGSDGYEVQSFRSYDPFCREWKSLPLYYNEANVWYMDSALLSFQHCLFLLHPLNDRSNILPCFNINSQQWISLSYLYDIGRGTFLVKDLNIYCVGRSACRKFYPDIENNDHHVKYLPMPDISDLVCDPHCCMLSIPYHQLE